MRGPGHRVAHQLEKTGDSHRRPNDPALNERFRFELQCCLSPQMSSPDTRESVLEVVRKTLILTASLSTISSIRSTY